MRHNRNGVIELTMNNEAPEAFSDGQCVAMRGGAR